MKPSRKLKPLIPSIVLKAADVCLRREGPGTVHRRIKAPAGRKPGAFRKEILPSQKPELRGLQDQAGPFRGPAVLIHIIFRIEIAVCHIPVLLSQGKIIAHDFKIICPGFGNNDDLFLIP